MYRIMSKKILGGTLPKKYIGEPDKAIQYLLELYNTNQQYNGKLVDVKRVIQTTSDFIKKHIDKVGGDKKTELEKELAAQSGYFTAPPVELDPNSVQVDVSSSDSSSKAEKINVNIYSYLDEIQQPVVKLAVSKEANDVIVNPEIQKLMSINKNTADLTIPKIIAEKNLGNLKFNEYFNKIPGEGAKSSIIGTQSTVANAIVELIKKRTEANKAMIDPFILFLRKQDQGKVLRLVENFEGKSTYDYYAQLVGKQATSEQLTENFNKIVNELQALKVKIHEGSSAKNMQVQGASQESALESLMNSINNFILKDKSGAISKKNFDTYIKNINALGGKINPDTGLLTGKNLLGSGFDPRKVMGQNEIEKAILTLSLFGGKTRKHKKSKSQKTGRNNKKTKKH